MSDTERTNRGFQIFRAADAPKLDDTGCMTVEPFSADLLPSVSKVIEAGIDDGQFTRLLVDLPGFSLTHVWFKRNYPLPLHSHDSDCLYYIIAGGVRLGTEELGPRDSFMVPADVPYTYRPGPEGVELLEFRHATEFNFVNHAKSPAFWEKALQAVTANHESWKTASMPALNS